MDTNFNFSIIKEEDSSTSFCIKNAHEIRKEAISFLLKIIAQYEEYYFSRLSFIFENSKIPTEFMFSNLWIKSVKLQNSSIGCGVFKNCNIDSFTLDNANEEVYINEKVFDNSQINNFYIISKSNIVINNYAFYKNQNNTSEKSPTITLEAKDGTISIGDFILNKCSSFKITAKKIELKGNLFFDNCQIEFDVENLEISDGCYLGVYNNSTITSKNNSFRCNKPILIIDSKTNNINNDNVIVVKEQNQE